VTNFGDRLFGVLNITSLSLKSNSTAKMVYDPIESNYDNKILDFNQDTAQFYSNTIIYGHFLSILIQENSELEIGLKSQEFIPNLYKEFDEQAMGLFMSPYYDIYGSNVDNVAELSLTLKCTQGIANFFFC
jgi:hypothetical protein